MTDCKRPTEDERALKRLHIAVVQTRAATLQSQQVLAEAVELLRLAAKLDTPLLRNEP
jgi:hypothetical protein